MQPSLNRIMLYVRDVQATCDFYERHFSFTSERKTDDRVTELSPANGGAILMVHPAGRPLKQGKLP